MQLFAGQILPHRAGLGHHASARHRVSDESESMTVRSVLPASFPRGARFRRGSLPPVSLQPPQGASDPTPSNAGGGGLSPARSRLGFPSLAPLWSGCYGKDRMEGEASTCLL